MVSLVIDCFLFSFFNHHGGEEQARRFGLGGDVVTLRLPLPSGSHRNGTTILRVSTHVN